MPRVKQFDKEEALQKATELFWEKGYEATSLSDLTDHLGIGKGSFYDTFKGKRALLEETLKLYGSTNISFLKTLLYSKKDVKEGIRHLFETTLQKGFSDEKHKGCFAANTCSELGNSDESIRQMLIEHNNVLHRVISDYLESGNLREDIDVQQVTRFYITFLTGLNQELKIKRDISEFKKSVDLLVGLLD